tara:strand:+ start:330 stop:470 length:141 start_codon:yes stop_codon:yes gene_type:complete
MPFWKEREQKRHPQIEKMLIKKNDNLPVMKESKRADPFLCSLLNLK